MRVNTDLLRRRFDALEAEIDKLRGKEKGSYEKLKLKTVERFVEYGREDIDNGEFERAVYVANSLKKMLNDDYVKRPKVTVELPGTEPLKFDGVSMYNSKNEPVFYVGYCGFLQLRRDIPYIHDLGANLIQMEIGPFDLLNPVGTHAEYAVDGDEVFESGEEYITEKGEYEINFKELICDIIPALEKAKKNGIAVNFLLSPHYMPRWLMDKYPELHTKSLGFIRYNIYHKKAKEILEVYLRALLPILVKYDVIQSFCLTNEPQFNSAADAVSGEADRHDLLPTLDIEDKRSDLTPEWQMYLKDIYGSIENLNEKWQTSYRDFGEIYMPQEDDLSPRFLEWSRWNNMKFAEWHRWLADIVREYAPDIPIQTKMVATFGTSDMKYHRRFLKTGIDPELIAEFTDCNGNDCCSFENRSHLPLSYKLMWYDYLTSIKKMPVHDTEDHVIEDRTKNYIPIQAKRIYADMWQGAIHGRGASTVWTWSRSNAPLASANGSVLHRPDCIEAIGRANYDLNRLKFEADSLQNVKSEIAILYSETARNYSMEYSADIFRSYEGALYSGIVTEFVTERQIKKIHDYRLLIITCIDFMKKSVLAELLKYVENGGKLLIIKRGENSLKFDEYKREADFDTVKGVMEKADIMDAPDFAESPSREFSEAVTDRIWSIIKPSVTVTEEGGSTYNIEWRTAELGGKQLINICCYGHEERRIKLTKNGKYIKNFKELLTDTDISEEKIVLKPYCPMVIEYQEGSL